MDQLYNAEPIYQAHASVKKVVSNTERRALNNDIGWVKDEGCRLARDILEAVRVILDGLKEQGPELHKEALNRNEELRKLMESSQIQREMNYQGLQHISLEHTNLMKENNTLKQKLSDTKRLHSQLKQETAGAREEFKRVVAANKVEQVLLARITRVTSIKRELDWVECVIVDSKKNTLEVRFPWREIGLTAEEAESNWQWIAEHTGVPLAEIFVNFPQIGWQAPSNASPQPRRVEKTKSPKGLTTL
eukprot:Protomagalhaensia_sp_Gyna_25__5177@NODE_615_length_3005_cov_186_914363_g439_i1_p3_GENE_NODE_615_length_3005_cov_186_914363_g439_i1NODE_615_length_3005_cov_186_914363_g439_i1_p3_ORF_typecomplete_len247_score36_85Tht1/PF04163_12/0_044CCDC73/PF15818_5/0_06DUF4201/PF13870_6/0_13DUF1955/PF09205_10/8_8DUF1955/PF09205_10/44Atg14/PF10186_9/0_81WEMBL/PF05701_11/0_72WEMBL/PF05701_11/13LRRFIP/PF09738_9/2_1Csm1_N/PF18504_1/1_7e03Csm1_N/PF18504_1/0_26JAKMIP_CC3/PF16034_5/2_4UPF0242/PF06785_11/6_6DivIVA/PF051